jgi:hypothetical protein
MSEPILPSPGPGYRRPARKHVGETWKPDTRNGPNISIGPWCHICRAIHPWKSKAYLDVKYEKRSGAWYIMWLCKKTGSVIKEEGMVSRHGA